MFFENLTAELRTYSWIETLALYLLVVLGVSSTAHYLVRRVQLWLVRRDQWPAEFSLVNQFFVSLQVFLLSLTLLLALPTLRVPNHIEDPLRAVAKVMTIFSLVAILMRIVRVMAKIYYRTLRTDRPDNLRQRRIKTQVQFIEQFIDVVIIFIGIASALFSFEQFRRFGGSLLASAGLASVIIGFAAQKSIANLIAGFQIAFTQPIRLGDALLVENEWGEVEEITLTYVVVRIWDLRRLVLPINYFLEKPFQNWTRTSANLIGQVLLYVDYEIPIDEVRGELQRIVEQSDLWDKQVCVLQVTDASDKSVTLRALVSASNAGTLWDLRCLVREKLIQYIKERHPRALPKSRMEFQPVLGQPFVSDNRAVIDS